VKRSPPRHVWRTDTHKTSNNSIAQNYERFRKNFSNDTTEKGRIFMLRETYFGKVIPWERKNRKCAEQSEIVKKIEDEERYFVQKLSSL